MEEPLDYPLAQRAMAIAWTAGAALAQGRLVAARTAYSNALELLLHAGYPSGEALVRTNLGAALHATGALDDARDELECALRIATDARTRAFARSRLGALDLEVGRLEEALQAISAAHEHLEATGEKPMATATVLGLGGVHHAAGRFDEARAFLDRGLAEATAMLDVSLQATALASLAQLDHEQRQVMRALDHAERALGLLDGDTTDWSRAAVLRIRGFLTLEMDDLEGSEADLQQARVLAQHAGDPHAVAATDGLLAVLEARNGMPDRAARRLDEAQVASAEHPPLLHTLGLLRGHVELAQGHADLARARLDAPLPGAISARLAHRILARSLRA